MSVTVACGRCLHSFDAPTRLRGGACRCPHCGRPVAVPALAAGSDPVPDRPRGGLLVPRLVVWALCVALTTLIFLFLAARGGVSPAQEAAEAAQACAAILAVATVAHAVAAILDAFDR